MFRRILCYHYRIATAYSFYFLSRDGVTGCGVFCAVYNAIQQLQQDEEVDMFTIVRQLQSRRPEMISEMVYLNAFGLQTVIDEKDQQLW